MQDVCQHKVLGYKCPRRGTGQGCLMWAQCKIIQMREYVSRARRSMWWSLTMEGNCVPPACTGRLYFSQKTSMNLQVLSNMKRTPLTIQGVRYIPLSRTSVPSWEGRVHWEWPSEKQNHGHEISLGVQKIGTANPEGLSWELEIWLQGRSHAHNDYDPKGKIQAMLWVPTNIYTQKPRHDPIFPWEHKM